MKFSLRVRVFLLAVVVVAAFVFACGCGDDDDKVTNGNGGGPTIYHSAKYCETGGFSFGSHTDEFVLDYSLDCYNGAEFDANVSKYTNDTIDIIFIGGDNTFSGSTAQAIEDAVYNDGKLLVINFWSNRDFDACLPAANGGNAAYGAYLEVVDSTNPIFEGLPTRFNRTGADYNREAATAKNGATVLLRYDNGDPALLYWKYGEGYVIEWTLELMHVFDFPGGAIDLIVYRTIKHCLSLP